MSRTIGQIENGTGVFVKEFDNWVEYIVMNKDSQGAELMRKFTPGSRRMNPTNTTIYSICEMDTYLLNDTDGFLARFDPATKAALVNRSISTFVHGDTECSYIDRSIYLPSQGNFFGGNAALYPEKNWLWALMKYYDTADPNTARIGRTEQGAAVNCWLRSPYSDPYFCNVHNYGTSSSYGASVAYGFRPVLNVSIDTIVSDEGSELIYLLPEQDYREVYFHGLMLETDVAVRQAAAVYNTKDLYDVKVELCNNYGDAEPVWVDATSQRPITFENQSKTTEKWMIGVRCYGKSAVHGYFEEPRIKLEVA